MGRDTDDKIITIPKDKILTIANATLPFTKRYHKLLGTLKANPQKLPSFVERDLTNEEYDDIDKGSQRYIEKFKIFI